MGYIPVYSEKDSVADAVSPCSYSTCFLSALGAVYKEKFGTATGKVSTEGLSHLSIV